MKERCCGLEASIGEFRERIGEEDDAFRCGAPYGDLGICTVPGLEEDEDPEASHPSHLTSSAWKVDVNSNTSRLKCPGSFPAGNGYSNRGGEGKVVDLGSGAGGRGVPTICVEGLWRIRWESADRWGIAEAGVGIEVEVEDLGSGISCSACWDWDWDCFVVIGFVDTGIRLFLLE